MDLYLVRLLVDEAALARWLEPMPTAGLVAVVAVAVVLLTRGADWMIDGVVCLARRTGVSTIVIGATIVSLGTTTPEAFVSVMAAFMGNPGLALGNGVGSIIADTGLIFGLTCLLAPVPVNRYILDRTGWVQVAVATLLVVAASVLAVSLPGPAVLPRPLGFFFLLLLAGYLYLAYRWAQQAGAEQTDDQEQGAHSLAMSWTMIGGGLVLVIASARVLVPAASQLALRFGVPEDVIAATMVAFGTSLPELITAVSAVRKGHPEITVGNIVGADVLNCLFVIGAAAAARPLAVPASFFYLHFPAMLLILYSFRLFIATSSAAGRFRRWHGAWLLGLYLAYIASQYGFAGTVAGH